MSRKAVCMSQSDWEVMLTSWARKMELQMDGDEEPETEQERAEHLASEAEDLKNFGEKYVWNTRMHVGLTGAFEVEHKISKDLAKVQFDWENCGCDLPTGLNPCGFWMTPSGVPTMGCYAGGDWEDPVFFVLYPESKTQIRAYMPKSGNTWNLKTKSAWGNGEDEDYDEGNPRKVDVDAFRADVAARLQAK